MPIVFAVIGMVLATGLCIGYAVGQVDDRRRILELLDRFRATEHTISLSQVTNMHSSGVFVVERTGVWAIPRLVWFHSQPFDPDATDLEVVRSMNLVEPVLVEDASVEDVTAIAVDSNWRLIHFSPYVLEMFDAM